MGRVHALPHRTDAAYLELSCDFGFAGWVDPEAAAHPRGGMLADHVVEMAGNLLG